MISKIRLSVFCAIAIFTAQPVWAESVYTCPDISQARQVGDCSSEEELIRMFASACGPRTMPGEDPDATEQCKSFEKFKQRKNTALWESADGGYMGYVTCNRPAAKIKKAKFLSINLGTKRVMDKIICSYEGGVNLILRTRESCQIPDAKLSGKYLGLDCTAGGANCKAICK